MRHKYLFIHGIGEIGGAERELLTISTGFSKRGYHTVVVCPNGTPFQRELALCGVATRAASFPPWRNVTGWFRRRGAVRSLRRVIAAEQPSLIHINDFWWVPQSLRACRGLQIPIVAHVREEIEPSKVKRYELDQADLVIAVSRHIQQAVEVGGVGEERARTIYSGLDLDRIPAHPDGPEVRRRLGLPVEAFVLGTVANLFSWKGHEVMLRAMPLILAEVPNAHYLIIGGGNRAYERELRLLAERLGVQRQVHFLGFQQDVYPWLAALDVYVHPALREGFGIAVLEAMAMGKAVIATRTGGIPELVESGATGVLVAPRDAAALVSPTLSLFRDPVLRERMGVRGRQRAVDHFSLCSMFQHLAQAYRKLKP